MDKGLQMKLTEGKMRGEIKQGSDNKKPIVPPPSGTPYSSSMEKYKQLIEECIVPSMNQRRKRLEKLVNTITVDYEKDTVAEFEGEYIYDELIETKNITDKETFKIEFYGKSRNWKSEAGKQYKVIIKEVE